MKTPFHILFSVALCWSSTNAAGHDNIIVAVNGPGDFRSIQDAINSIGSNQQKPVIILIRNGIYNEKVFIQKSHVTLVGEDEDSTRIVYPELRENWNKDHNGSDWGSAVVNIDTGVTDVTFANLAVYNNYGWQNDVFNKHQFAIRGAGTRIMLLHCKVKSDGGDAVSLWDKEDGMYYHANCYFEGWVDYVCPRGWCYVTNSRFFGHNLSASIWHDGDFDKSQKFVILDSYFDGVPGFPLGRNHRDGQIFLVNCRFSERMADRPIYHPASSKTGWKWGARHYYYNCHRDGGDFDWFKDNLEKADGSPAPSDITAKWTFDGKWDPEAAMPSVLPFAFLPVPRNHTSDVSVEGVNLGWIPGRNAESHSVYFGTGTPPKFKAIQVTSSLFTGKLEPRTTYFWRVDEMTEEGVIPGELWSFRTQD